MAEQFVASKQLPVVLQSTKLKNFFDSTVDQWFKNEDNEYTHGFVGRREGRIFEPKKDAYLGEPSIDRFNYQLEPSVVVRDNTTQGISYQTTYDDFVNKLRFDGGQISNHKKLFEEDYYSFAPPIDIDKFLNYANYYWYPAKDDLTTETSGVFPSLPAIVVDGSGATPIDPATDIIGKQTYTAPDATVFTNGLQIKFGQSITNDAYKFRHTITAINLNGGGSQYAVNDKIIVSTVTIGHVTSVNAGGTITGVELTNPILGDGVTPTAVTITTASGNGALLTITTSQTDITYIIEGVGTEIKLIDTKDLRNLHGLTTSSKDYLTMQRGCKDGNIWSKTNGWVHKNTLDNYPSVTTTTEEQHLWDTEGWAGLQTWDSITVSSTTAFTKTTGRRATRPIIEFNSNMELYDYGKNHILDVTVIEDTLTKTQIESYANITIDGRQIQNRDTILFPSAASQDDYVAWDGNLWDHDTDSDISTGGGGQTGGDLGWDVSSSAFTIEGSIWQVSGVGTALTLTQVITSVNENDKVYIDQGTKYGSTEWYYDGYNWNQAQLKSKVNTAPLFNLFDNNKVILNDTGIYPSSTFTGSKVFGYKVGSGTNDAELGFPLSYVSGSGQSDIEFCNYLNIDSYTYNTSTAISGYKFYKQFLYPETIAKTTNYEVNINPSQRNTANNVFYINGEESPILILQRGDTYNFKFSSPESGSTGYTGVNHPFYISTGTPWSSGTYTGEYTTGVTGSRAYYGGTYSTLEFTVPSNAPDTLYYHSATSNNPVKLVVVDNPITKINEATETFYKNEWNKNLGSKKLKQRLVQEHTVSNTNLTTNPTLEVIPTSIIDMEVYKNGIRQKFGTDYTTTASVILNFTTALVENDFIKIYYETNDKKPIRQINYFEIPKNLESNASNEEVVSGTYSEFFQHFESIIQNQIGFTGDVSGANNYRDTEKDLGKGKVILQHDGSLMKAMAFANNDDLDIISSIRYVKNRYQEFQLKFLNAVNKIQVSQDASLLTTSQIVDKAIKNITIDKIATDPFTYSFMMASGDRYTTESHTITSTNYTWGSTNTFLQSSDTQEVFNQEPGLTITSAYNPKTDYDSKALYVYKNNVLMTYNHDYIISHSSDGTKIIFIGYAADKPKVNDVILIRYYTTIQPTWIPPTPAKLGAAKVYQPVEISDTVTYSTGTRNFIQCHDGSLVLKYNDLRDTALLELEKRIYNTVNRRFTSRDYVPLLEINQKQPNYFNSTSWTRDDIIDLMRPIFTRWASENALNYHENTGYNNVLTLTGVSGTFTVGETIRGGTSRATGVITKIESDVITVNTVVDSFQLNETVTGVTSGASGTINPNGGITIDWKVLNYSSLKDPNGNSLPGHWRGIYRWFYGTDRPHTHPWEMLGFAQKPIWWDNYYSWTTTATRKKLIDDIEQGIIRSGLRENYIDKSYLNANNVYKKPNFSSYVPVDNTGKLLSPKETGIISDNPTEYNSQLDWKFGDGAPVENAFVISPVYQYAIQKILYLTAPGLYIDLLWNSNDIVKSSADATQIIDSVSGKRPNNKNYYVHRETDTNSVTYNRAGVQNFLVEHLYYTGTSVTGSFGNVVRNLQTNLSYRCAGFIDSSTLTIESQAYDSVSNSTSIVIPTEDINISLHTGGSINEVAYSGFIVQVVEQGYKVFGYDIVHPYFNILKPMVSGRSKKLRVGGKEISPVSYKAGTTYHTDEIVVHGDKYYQSLTTQVTLTTDATPDLNKWKVLKVLPTVGGTEVDHFYDYDESSAYQIDYGTVFKTRQAVYDAIVGYGKYLELVGWDFSEFNVDVGENKNWEYSAKEFLFWSLGKWDKGNYVTLSPCADKLKFIPQSGVVQSIKDINNGVYSALNKEGFGLDATQLEVMRDDDMVTISQKAGIGIYGLRLSVKETEHMITLENKTIFNDTIYNTVLAQRQPRVKINTTRTLGWHGKLEADGYIISGTSLINNFEKSVADTGKYYDIESSLVDTNFRDSAMHLIGFQERDYLTNLQINKTNQVKFYQGMIKQKGTQNSIDRLLRSTTVSTDQTFDTYEEWAFKVGEFGSTAFEQQIELKVKSDDVVSDPQTFEFLLPSDDATTSGYDSPTDNVITIDIDDTARWLKKPKGEKTLANLWPVVSTVNTVVPTSGYVHYDDPTYRALNSNALANVYSSETSNITIGSTTWVAKDDVAGRDWNTYKLYDTGDTIDNIVSNGDANTAMKVTVSGTGSNIGVAKDLIIHKTYDGNGTLVMDPTSWGTHKITLSTATPTAPTITIPFSGIAGNGAEMAVGNINGTVSTVTVTGGGDGFAVGDVISFAGSNGTGGQMTVNKVAGGAGATASAVIADTFPITSIQVLEQGSGYSSATVNISGGGGSGATATATIAGGKITAITLTGAGSGYTYQPTITITGDGNDATAFATLGSKADGQITSITVSGGGTGYTATPIVKITDTSGTGATATAVMSGGAVASVTITNSGSGYTAPTVSFTGPLSGATTGSELTLNNGGDNYAEAPTSYSVVDSSGITKTSGVHYTPATFTYTGDGASGVFGEIKDITITAGGSNYQSPSIKIINASGTTVHTLTTPTNITLTSGSITAVTVPTGAWNKGFSAGVISTATGKITVTDTKANHTVNLSPSLAKVHALTSLTANVTTAFDGTPSVTLEKSEDNGASWNALSTAAVDLTTVASANVNVTGTITDNANAIVRAKISVSTGTTGNVSLSLNYTKKEYTITKNGNAEYISTADNTTINSSGIKLLDWKDVRLNNALATDKAHVVTSTATTLTNFLTGTGLSNSVWTEGALVWLDDDFTGKWGVYRYTADASIVSTYNNIRGNEPASFTAAGGTWILHSGVDYSNTSETTASYFAKTKRRQKDRIDTTQFNKTEMYDDRSHQVNLSMNIFDPLKGILPASADREISYKSELDPAIYNNHSDTTLISTNNPWKDDYVGKVWWDQSTARFIEYESHDNDYRRTHWGRLFDGASIDVYEWVKSTLTPSTYTGTGTVKSTTNYVSETIIDPYTKTNLTYYYYWVKNKTSVPKLDSRISDVATVSNLIQSPLTQGLSYFAPISPNSFMISNVINNLTKENTVLQINYRDRATKDKTDGTHAQWLLIKENYKDAQIPNQIWNKMVDSICGYDVTEKTVPDTTLSINDRYGNKVRPRQTWFKDLKKARKVLFQSVNNITTNISLDIENSNWDSTVTTSVYYEKTNWYYNTTFSDNTIIDEIVDYKDDIVTANLNEGDVVKVNYDYASKWALYKYTDADYLAGTTTSIDTSNLSLVRIGLQTATTKFKTTLYTEDNSTALATELRQYLTALRNNVFISDKLGKQNDVLFALIRYVASEQSHIDWLFKTTYMNVIQQDTTLTQKASYEKDPFNDIKSYVEEVKPYKAKIRDFLSKKSPARENANMAMSDFTSTSDYATNSSGSGTINPTPKFTTKLAFDRISKKITILSPTTNNIDSWMGTTVATISGATKSNPVSITAIGHGFTSGRQVTIDGVNGMTNLNTNTYTITRVDDDTFTLNSTDGTTYGAYTSGGTATAIGLSYTAGKELKHNGGYWQVTTNHTSGTFISDVQTGKLQRYNFSPVTNPTDVASINQIKQATPESSHVDRLAKYHFASELANVDTANTSSVSSFVTSLENAISSYTDLDIQPIGFVVNRDRIGQELTSFAWDSLKWDATALTTNPTIGFADESTQNWYDSKFVNENLQWKTGTVFTKDSFVQYSDLTHFTAWTASTSYTVGDIVKHESKVYVANVTHKNLTAETTMQTSRWDEVVDLIYYTNAEHTAGATFKTDYDAGKWVLVQKVLDSSGFARPNNDPYPEEVLPITPRESLFITVKTYEAVTGSGTNADPYVGDGDLSQYMMHYRPYGTVTYLRQKFVDSTLGNTAGNKSTTDHTTLSDACSEYSNIIVVSDASKLPVPKQSQLSADGVYTSQPGVIYIGTERIEYNKISGNKLLGVVRGTRGTTIGSYSPGAEVYSGNTYIPSATDGFYNADGWSLHDDNSSGRAATYLKNGELDNDYVSGTDLYVDPNQNSSGKAEDNYVE